MSDRLVTVAVFQTPVEATLARNLLDDAGIRSFLQDAEAAGMAWHMAGAYGGVKLQVAEADVDRAVSILEGVGGPESSVTEEGAAENPPPEPEFLTETETGGVDALERVLTQREKLADKAFRGAVFGMIFCPLQIWVFWLLLKVFLSNESLSDVKRWKAIFAAVFNLPYVIGIVWWLKMLAMGI